MKKNCIFLFFPFIFYKKIFFLVLTRIILSLQSLNCDCEDGSLTQDVSSQLGPEGAVAPQNDHALVFKTFGPPSGSLTLDSASRILCMEMREENTGCGTGIHGLDKVVSYVK